MTAERAELADGLKLATGVVESSVAETRASLLGENSRLVVLKPDQEYLALVAEQMGLNFVIRDFNYVERLVRVISSTRERLANLFTT